MNNKINFFVQKAIAKLPRIKFRTIRSLPELAQFSGVPVVYMANRPASYEGYLDWHNEPRFIAVNPDLPVHKQAIFVARQIALRAQQREVDSLALNRPWKWELLKVAPAEAKEKILMIDQEYRAYWLMLFFANRDEYRPFARENRKQNFVISFGDNIIRYHLYKLWIKVRFNDLLRRLTLGRNPVS